MASLAITEPDCGLGRDRHDDALHAGGRRHRRRRRQDVHHQRRRRRPAAGVRQVERDRRRASGHLGADRWRRARPASRSAGWRTRWGCARSSTAALEFDKVPRAARQPAGAARRRAEDPAGLAQQVAAQHRRACAGHRHRRVQGHDGLHEYAPAIGAAHRRVPGQPVHCSPISPASWRCARRWLDHVADLSTAARPTSASRRRSPSCAASDLAMRMTTDAVQMHGGYGYIRDYRVERLMRDAKITQIWEGTNQVHRQLIGRSFVDEMSRRSRPSPSAGRAAPWAPASPSWRRAPASGPSATTWRSRSA